MSQNKKVRDVMIGIFEYPHIPYWFSINQAMRIVKVSFLRSKKYIEPMAVLIFDEKYNFMGTVTLKSILRGTEPKIGLAAAEATPENLSETPPAWDLLFSKESKERAEKPVSEIMVPARFFVEPDDSIIKAAYLMIRHDLVLLPVLEERKKFVGLVRMVEIFDEISDMLLSGQEE